MMNNNKILTVSYGTFSCTLEGFDDSFGTMKAIAEYFRDLAADDRYFGAEPPQPDAEMLARIAQKEISRRVQAREHDGRIVLSALEDNRPAPPATQTAAGIAALATASDNAAPVAAEAEPQDTEPQIVADTADDAEKAVAAEAHVDLDVVIGADGEAETAQTPADAQDDTPEPIAPAPTVADDDAPDAVATEERVAETAREDTADEADIVPGQPDETVEAFFADLDATATAQEFEDETETATAEDAIDAPASVPAPATAPAPDSIAAKLQRIRAVVAQHDEAETEADYAEDQHADPNAEVEDTAEAMNIEDEAADTAADQPATADTITQARHDIEDALIADDAADEAARRVASGTDDPVEAANDYDAILARLEQEDDLPDTAETNAEDDAAFDDEGTSETDDALANLFGRDDDLADDTAEAGQETGETVPDAAPAPPRARVIKVKRADLEAAIERGELEEYDDDMPETAQDDIAPDHADNRSAPETAGEQYGSETSGADPALDDLAPAKTDTSSLSAEDEQELARELAELEKDIEGDAPARATADADASAEQSMNERKDATQASARHVLPRIEDETTGDMSRLMAEADHQMDEPESATRRNAFAHLRAAVAAKKADAAVGISDDDDKMDDAYRSDLAEVVRPRRPVSGSARTARPEEARPAPLKLVAEQRIDVDAPRPAGPVRPRRVAATAATPATAEADGESFADYAEDMGATSLSELLEAAASYMSFVEGCEQFSRPQLMSKVRQVGPQDGFSREDGLRSFGQLLRAGKIEKIKGGRFTVSDDIGYRPDQRAAG